MKHLVLIKYGLGKGIFPVCENVFDVLKCNSGQFPDLILCL